MRSIGELALEIRGTTGVLDLYMKAGAFDLIIEQISRGKRLEKELDYIIQNKYKLGNNLVLRDWLRIAQEEVKDLLIMIRVVSLQIPDFKILDKSSNIMDY